MSVFSVNGVVKDLPVRENDRFRDLLTYLQSSYISETSVISAIRVDGIELGELGDPELGERVLADIASVEVFTAHPREVAHESLQALLDFTIHLAGMSFQTADLIGMPEFHGAFIRLLDGMHTMTEAIDAARRIMRVGTHPRADVLQADLISILKDILQARETGQNEYLLALLREHLPRNLEDWRSDGLPALIRARDS